MEKAYIHVLLRNGWTQDWEWQEATIIAQTEDSYLMELENGKIDSYYKGSVYRKQLTPTKGK